jgi:hypothetical protein
MLIVHLPGAGKRNDEENAKEKPYTYASYVSVPSFKVRGGQFFFSCVHTDSLLPKFISHRNAPDNKSGRFQRRRNRLKMFASLSLCIDDQLIARI